jgi:hypothetical protein
VRVGFGKEGWRAAHLGEAGANAKMKISRRTQHGDSATMNRVTSLGLACLTVLALSGCNQPLPGAQAQAQPPSVCLASYNIDHTDIPDDSNILFTMRDHTVYRNHLDQPCFGLRNDTRGYTYEPTVPGSDEICSNLVIIHLNTFHNVCALGPFTKISPLPAAPHA